MAKPLNHFFYYLSLGTWVLLGLWLGVHWMGPHVFALQAKPLNFETLLKAENRWSLTHFVSENCQCSEWVLARLRSRAPLYRGELVLLIGNLPESLRQELEAKGYQIQLVSPESFKQPVDLALPTLLVQNPQNQVVYAGGYAAKKISQVSEVQDLEIWQHITTGKKLEKPFPIYGCYTSAKWGQWSQQFKIVAKNRWEKR